MAVENIFVSLNGGGTTVQPSSQIYSVPESDTWNASKTREIEAPGYVGEGQKTFRKIEQNL
jgi:hypothetical protein